MSWQDILKVSESEVVLTIEQLIADANSLKLSINAGIKQVYEPRFKDVTLAFKDVKSDMQKLLQEMQKSDPMDKVTSTTSTGQDEEAANRTKDNEKELLARILERNNKARES